MTMSMKEMRRQMLNTPGAVSGYLNAVLEEGDGEELRLALKNLLDAQAGGVGGLVKRLRMKATGVNKLLAADGCLDLAGFRKIIHGLGLRLTVKPLPDAAAVRAEEAEEAEAPPATMSASQPPAGAAAMHAQRPEA